MGKTPGVAYSAQPSLREQKAAFVGALRHLDYALLSNGKGPLSTAQLRLVLDPSRPTNVLEALLDLSSRATQARGDASKKRRSYERFCLWLSYGSLDPNVYDRTIKEFRLVQPKVTTTMLKNIMAAGPQIIATPDDRLVVQGLLNHARQVGMNVATALWRGRYFTAGQLIRKNPTHDHLIWADACFRVGFEAAYAAEKWELAGNLAHALGDPATESAMFSRASVATEWRGPGFFEEALQFALRAGDNARVEDIRAKIEQRNKDAAARQRTDEEEKRKAALEASARDTSSESWLRQPITDTPKPPEWKVSDGNWNC